MLQSIKNDLPELKNNIFKILSTEILNGTFDIEECNEAKASSYYRHIDFSSLM